MNKRTSIKSCFVVALGFAGLCVLPSACAPAVEEAPIIGAELTSPAGNAGSESIGEAAQADSCDHTTTSFFACTNGGYATIGTLTVNVTSSGTYCFRSSAICSGDMSPPPADPSKPSCWSLAKNLGCIGF